MRNTHFFKIFLTCSFLSHGAYASDTLDDDGDHKLNQAPSMADIPLRDFGQKPVKQTFKNLDQSTITLIGPSHGHSGCGYTVMDSKGGAYQITPLLLLSHYQGLRAEAEEIINEANRLRKENAGLQQRNAVLTSDHTHLSEQVKIANKELEEKTEKQKTLEQSKAALERSVTSLSASNTFLKQNNTSLNTELSRACLSAERLVEEKSALLRLLEQLQQENAGLYGAVEKMKYHSSELININEQLTAQLNFLTRQQQLAQAQATIKLIPGLAVKPNGNPQN